MKNLVHGRELRLGLEGLVGSCDSLGRWKNPIKMDGKGERGEERNTAFRHRLPRLSEVEGKRFVEGRREHRVQVSLSSSLCHS